MYKSTIKRLLKLKALNKKQLTVVDIGDSAGTHMRYLKELTQHEYDIKTISVNMEKRGMLTI
jgi:hypothetical protein